MYTEQHLIGMKFKHRNGGITYNIPSKTGTGNYAIQWKKENGEIDSTIYYASYILGLLNDGTWVPIERISNSYEIY